jgi:hypothetical protein
VAGLEVPDLLVAELTVPWGDVAGDGLQQVAGVVPGVDALEHPTDKPASAVVEEGGA